MYESKMVCCLKANGKILREFKDTVYVPFGTEYSILIKNLNSLRAIVNITIDGTVVVPGGLVVNANQEIDLERFVKDMSNGNKFKFIERSASVEAGRGIKSEDGLIRISFEYAKPTPVQQPSWGQTSFPHYPPGVRGFNNIGSISGSLGNFTNIGGSLRSVDYSKGEFVKSMASASIDSYCSLNNIKASSAVHDGMATMDCSVNDVGITVPGSLSEQKFVTVSDFVTESEEHVIILRILGETDNAPIVEPITVKAKPKCTTCNKINKATSKFCANCGTSLEVW